MSLVTPPFSAFHQSEEQQKEGRLAVRLAALTAMLLGLLNIWSAMAPSIPWRREILHELLPVHLIHAGRTLVVFSGFTLLYLGTQLWRRKRRAWQLAIGVLTVSLTLHLVKGLDYEEATLCLAGIALLWPIRRHFFARHDPDSFRTSLRIVAFAVIAVTFYGLFGFAMLRHQFGGHIARSTDFVVAAWTWFFTLDDKDVYPRTARAVWFVHSLDTLSMAAFATALLALCRPLLHREAATEAEREEVRHLLLRYGKTDIAYFCLLPDKTYFWNPARTGVIAYKLVGNVALALGDPIASDADTPEIVDLFLAMCLQHDWRPSFYQVTPEFAHLMQGAGMSLLKIGEDALLDLHAMTLVGKAGKGMRGTLNALEKQGVAAVMYDLKTDPGHIADDLRRLSDAWLRAKHGSEKTYSLGYYDRERMQEHPLMVAFGPDGRPLAFESLVPMYAADGYAGDLNRCLPGAPKRIQEYLIIRTAIALQERGYRWYGQGLAPLATMGDPTPGAPPISEKGVALLFEHFNVFYGFRGLRAFKQKFDPVWESRYLVYPHPALLPKVATAIVRADSRGKLTEFLRLPSRRKPSTTSPPASRPETCG